MRGLARTVIQATVCGALVLFSGPPGWPAAHARPAARIVYNLFATHGYVPAGDGSILRINGFVGGREGQPLTYVDESGQQQTLDEGAPAPTAGPLTEAERKLLGHAQLMAPLIWATSSDVVDVRLKHLGSAESNMPSSPVGIEFRGLNVTAPGSALPETSLLAIPYDDSIPFSGNVLSYTFRATKPGTYAYGWSYDAHAGHETSDDASLHSSHGTAAPAGTAMPDGCPCPAMRLGGSAGSLAVGASGSPFPAHDGALVIYGPGDAALQAGPGMGAGGTLSGMRYDQDYVVLITGGEPVQPADRGAMQMAAMPGMPGAPEAPLFFVNGLRAGSYSGIAAGAAEDPTVLRGAHPGYRPFAPVASPQAGRVLVRILNLSTSAQPLAAVTLGHKVTGYQSRTLEVGYPASRNEFWGAGSGSPADGGPVAADLQPGVAVDVVLDLRSSPGGSPGDPSRASFVTAAVTGGATQPAISAMAGMDATPAGTMSCSMPAGTTMQAPGCGFMSSSGISGTLVGGAKQCPLLIGAR